MSKKSIAKEQDLQAILDKISDDNRVEGEILVKELSFIIKTLDKLKDIIDTNGVIEDFKQGKQEFKRESTALKSYNATIKTYNNTFTNLLKLVDVSNDVSTSDSNIMSFDDFSFEIFCSDYDIEKNIQNTKEYKQAKDETQQKKIYNKLLQKEYAEYKKNPTEYLTMHQTY